MSSVQTKHEIYWVLAFDIERAGATEEFDTIAIGATVLDSNYVALGSYLSTCYVPGETRFEKKCYDEFWSKHKHILKALENVDTKLSRKEKEKQMITGFVDFVKAWENKAQQQHVQLHRVCDNSPFDVHFINILIYEYYNSTLNPFPYQFNTRQYGSLWETHSMMKGFLLATNNAEKARSKNWGFSGIIRKMYPHLPKCAITQDHMPHHDAHVIAHQFIWLMSVM